MKTSLVLTIIGADRPGLVEAVSEKALAHGANWEASRMARLGGRFAGVLLVTVDEAKVQALEVDLLTLERTGLKVIVERSAQVGSLEDYRRLRLDLVGNDRTGIIREISGTLAQRGVNVDELDTEVSSAPMSGGTLFRMSAVLRSPPSLSLDELRDVLEGFANELMVDITLEDS